MTTEFSVSNQFARISPALVYGRYAVDNYLLSTPAAKAGGCSIPAGVSAQEAFRLADCAFSVEKRPVHVPAPDGTSVTAREHCAIVRTDTNAVLGVHGHSYTPVQQGAMIQLLEFLREDLQIENVLSLRGGQMIFATASLGLEEEVTEGDRIRRYLHLCNSHDGSSAFSVAWSSTRLFCANQLEYLSGKGMRQANRDGTGLSKRHTQSVEVFARSLPERIDLEQQRFRRSISELKPLTTLRLSTAQARQVLEHTYAAALQRPITDRASGQSRGRRLEDLPQIETIRSHYEGGTGIAIEPRTAWGLFQAISQYETHDAGRRKDPVAAARSRLISLWGGEGCQRIDRARSACLAMV